MKHENSRQEKIRLGTHGEDYGSWMSNPVFYMVGTLLALSVALAGLSFAVFHIAALGVLFSVAVAALLALLVWITWIRKQYAFGGGGMMERVHKVVLSHLDFDGQGSLLEVGCGSGALSIRAALTWPGAQVTGHRLLGRGLRLRPGHVREERRERRCGSPVPVSAWGREQAGLPGQEFRRRGEQLCLSQHHGFG